MQVGGGQRAAERDPNVDVDELFVSADLRSTGGPPLKRIRPRAMGRVFRILKRACHVTIDLDVPRDGTGLAERGGGSSSGSESPSLRVPARVSTRPGARAGTPRRSTPSCSTRISSCGAASRSASAHAGVSASRSSARRTSSRSTSYTSRPGIIIGRKGAEVDRLQGRDPASRPSATSSSTSSRSTSPRSTRSSWPRTIAMQLVTRVAFRRAMRKAVESALRFGAKGIKVRVAGRLGGREIARSRVVPGGPLPLHTLRADIDYGFAEAAARPTASSASRSGSTRARSRCAEDSHGRSP